MRQRVSYRQLMEVAIVFAVAFTLACNRPVSIVTPQGQKAYTANEVLKRVQELQNATIDAEASKTIPTDVARVIITYTVDAAKVLGATPDGWGKTVAVAWQQAKAKIPPQYLTNPYLNLAVIGLDTVLASFGGVQ